MPQFDDDDAFGDAPAKREYSKAKVPDGEYDAQIEYAELRTTKGGGDVFSMKFTILGDGASAGKRVERAIFLYKNEGTDEEKAEHRKKKIGDIKADFGVLGFDVENWVKPARPYTQQLPLACAIAIAMKVRIKVKNRGENMDVYLNKRLPDEKPAKVGAAEMAAQAAEGDFGRGATGGGQPAAAAQPANSDPIPF